MLTNSYSLLSVTDSAAVQLAMLVHSGATAGMALTQHMMTRACIVVAFVTIFPVLFLVELGLMVLELSGWSVGVRATRV